MPCLSTLCTNRMISRQSVRIKRLDLNQIIACFRHSRPQGLDANAGGKRLTLEPFEHASRNAGQPPAQLEFD